MIRKKRALLKWLSTKAQIVDSPMNPEVNSLKILTRELEGFLLFRGIFLCFVTFAVGCSFNGWSSNSQRFLSSIVVDGSGYKYDRQDTSCDGFPALEVETMTDSCLGLVIGHDNNKQSGKLKMKMPRQIVRIPGTNPDQFLVTDMGGWGPGRGSLFLLKPSEESGYETQKLLGELDLPHGLAYNPQDQFYYLGENNQIIRFQYDSTNQEILSKQVIVKNLIDVAKHMHPLTHFTFNPVTGDMYINSGAPNDHCFQGNGNYKERCPDETINKMASIQKVSKARLDNLQPGEFLDEKDFEIIAKGLRNSMALTTTPNGRFLIQGENSRDFPELEEPYEEMNLIQLDKPAKHYGWPYCYNFHAASPEWEDIHISNTNKIYFNRNLENEESFNQLSTDERNRYLFYKNNPQKLRELHGENPFYCGLIPINRINGEIKNIKGRFH